MQKLALLNSHLRRDYIDVDQFLKESNQLFWENAKIKVANVSESCENKNK